MFHQTPLASPLTTETRKCNSAEKDEGFTAVKSVLSLSSSSREIT